MEDIDFYQNVGRGREATFLLLYSVDGQPWANYDGAPEIQRDLRVPQVLALGRSDGLVGFVGGVVDEGEHPEVALEREVLEEIGYQLTSNPRKLVRLPGLRFEKYVYDLEVPHEELQEIAANVHKAQHYGSEITGAFLMQLIDYQALTGRNYGGLQNVLRQPFAGSARKELAHLITKRNLMSALEFSRISELAGFSSGELLVTDITDSAPPEVANVRR